ncbi:MAG: hypothetical protein RLZZ127_1993 [Planctomycetota bacterium]|jgi:hypothetical protein
MHIRSERLRHLLTAIRINRCGSLVLSPEDATRLIQALDAAEDLCAAYEVGQARGGSVSWEAVDMAHDFARAAVRGG